MSTALAIASVTQVLKDLLNNGLIDHNVTGVTDGNVVVTALSPDKIDTSSNEQSQLNLFMYQATPNQGWRNQDLPALNSQGERVSNPPLALDLHYILSAYGSNELHTEILLGYGMQLLHETPVLVRDAIRRALALPLTIPGGVLPDRLKALSTSELAEQVEQIRITPEILSTEEISKLWSAFQAKYRPSSSYRATVVLIESRKSARSALPVQDRRIYVYPFHQPVIEKILSQSVAGAPAIENQKILPGYLLVLRGMQLKGESVRVHMENENDELVLIPSPADITDSQIIVKIPATLQAGVHGVQVSHQQLMGNPPSLRQGALSNVQAFVLHPNIKAVQITNPTDTGNDLRTATVELEVEPAIRQSQRVVLLLNEFSASDATPAPLSYSFPLPPASPADPSASTVQLVIPVSGVKAGTYLVRIQIGGAESPLQTDATGRYNAPQAVIP